MNTIKLALIKISSEYHAAEQEVFSGHEWADFIRNDTQNG